MQRPQELSRWSGTSRLTAKLGDKADASLSTTLTREKQQRSTLEQQITTNTKLDSLVSALNKSNSFSALSYMGATVDVNGSTSVAQNGQAKWSYILNKDAENMMLVVRDDSGRVVETNTLSGADAGTYAFTLNTGDYDLPEGTALHLSIQATDADHQIVDTSISSSMVVKGVSTDNTGQVTLQAGDYSFSADKVTSFKQST